MQTNPSPVVEQEAEFSRRLQTARLQTVNILFAFDGSEHSVAAIEMLERCFTQAQPPGGAFSSEAESAASAVSAASTGALSAEITALCVLPTQYFESHQIMQAALDKASARLSRQGFPVKTLLKSGNPAPAIIDYAEEIDADLILVGAQGLRATLGILLGGVAQQIVEYAQRPVMVVRAAGAGRPTLRQVLVVVDGSPASQKAVEYLAPHCPGDPGAVVLTADGLPLRPAGDMPAHPFDSHAHNPHQPRHTTTCSWLPPNSEITLMHVLPPPLTIDAASRAWTLGPEVLYPAPLSPIDRETIEAQERQAGDSILQAGRQRLEAAGYRVRSVLERGDAATQILQHTRDHPVDLVVCGSRGLNPVSGWLLGSVSRKLVHYCGCSVLIVK